MKRLVVFVLGLLLLMPSGLSVTVFSDDFERTDIAPWVCSEYAWRDSTVIEYCPEIVSGQLYWGRWIDSHWFGIERTFDTIGMNFTYEFDMLYYQNAYEWIVSFANDTHHVTWYFSQPYESPVIFFEAGPIGAYYGSGTYCPSTLPTNARVYLGINSTHMWFRVVDTDTSTVYCERYDSLPSPLPSNVYRVQHLMWPVGTIENLGGEPVRQDNVILEAPTTITLPQCTGTVSLTLNNYEPREGVTVTGTVTGLSSECDGKAVYIRDGSCAGTTLDTCTLLGGSCGASFTAPSPPGTHNIYACVDKNDDGDFADSGEQDYVTINVVEVLTIYMEPDYQELTMGYTDVYTLLYRVYNNETSGCNVTLKTTDPRFVFFCYPYAPGCPNLADVMYIWVDGESYADFLVSVQPHYLPEDEFNQTHTVKIVSYVAGVRTDDATLVINLKEFCNCTPWTSGYCVNSTHRLYTRECTPIGCDITSTFLEDPSCSVEKPPPVNITAPPPIPEAVENYTQPFVWVNKTEMLQSGYGWLLPFLTPFFWAIVISMGLSLALEVVTRSGGKVFLVALITMMLIGGVMGWIPAWVTITIVIIAGFMLTVLFRSAF